MEEKREFNFGFNSRRPGKKEEEMKFQFPYVEIIPSKGKGSVTKFRLLNGVDDLLSFNAEINKVSVFQLKNNNEDFFLANTTALESNPKESKVNKDNSFNSKELHKRICENLELNLEETLYFRINKVEVPDYEGLNVIQFVSIEDGIEETPEDASPDEPKFEPIDPTAEVPEM